jgi:hypothetical protein
MVEWLAGNRIKGTTAERPVFGLTSGFAGWKEMDRTVIGSDSQTVTVSNLDDYDKKYYMMLYRTKKNVSGSWNQPRIRMGTNGSVDGGGNYGIQYNITGASGGHHADTGGVSWCDPSTPTFPIFGYSYIVNKAGQEKMGFVQAMDSNTAGDYVPRRCEGVYKYHANTSTSITDLQVWNAGGNNFLAGSELIVLGYDPTDTHTDNFWEELADVNLSGGQANYIETSTFAKKKNLWVQVYVEQDVDSNHFMTFNGDSASGSYSHTYSNDGASDITNGSSKPAIVMRSRTADQPSFMNIFISNIDGDEKLAIINQVNQNTAGAGASPTRTQQWGKWQTTSGQIEKIRVTSGSNGSPIYKTNARLKVWGAD